MGNKYGGSFVSWLVELAGSVIKPTCTALRSIDIGLNGSLFMGEDHIAMLDLYSSEISAMSEVNPCSCR